MDNVDACLEDRLATLKLVKDLAQALDNTAMTECPSTEDVDAMEDAWLRARRLLKANGITIIWPSYWGSDPEGKQV